MRTVRGRRAAPIGAPAAGKPPSSASPRLMTRALGLVFLGAPILGAVCLSLPDAGPRAPGGLMVVLVLAALVGVALLAAGRLLPQRLYSPVLLAANLAISVGFYFTGDPKSGAVLVYLWTTPYAFWFFSLRRAVAHAVLAAFSCAVVLVAFADDLSPRTLAETKYFGVWLQTVTTIAVVGMLVRWLATSLQRYSEQHARNASAQAALAALGRRGLSGASVPEVFEAALGMVCDRDQTAYAALHRAGAGEELWLIRDSGDGGTPDALLPQCREAIRAGQPVVSPDLLAETRYASQDLARVAGMRSSVSVPFRLPDGAMGVLSICSPVPGRFSQDDVPFLLATANVLSSVAERDAAEQRMRYAALHDPLTALPNRTLFLDRVDQALRLRRRTGDLVAVMLLDLNGFKVVNDSLGHAAGDQLLSALAPRLAGVVRPSDTVARLGGDEFVVLCGGLSSESEVVEIAERITTVWSEPLALGDRSVFVAGSIGIAVARDDSTTPQDLLRDADAAMYRAKAQGRSGYEIYGENLRASALERLELEGQLRGAVDRGELFLRYQPVVNVVTGHVVGAEALLRWNHPHHGVVAPSDFVPLAEDTGMIVQIGRWVLHEACAQLARWREEVPNASFRVTVNVSARQLAEPRFADEVRALVAEFSLPPGSLALELTESVLIDPSPDTVATLDVLRRGGVPLLLDDFGTGYSSLAYLQRFPIDVLKLDRSFVSDLGSGLQGTALVRAMIDMANALGLPVIAEGVERPEQAAQLRQLGCRLAQGFLWSAPLRADDVTQLLTGRLDEAAVPVG